MLFLNYNRRRRKKMNKTVKKIITIAVILVVLGGVIAGFFVWRHNSRYISKNEAMEIALTDAGVQLRELIEYDVDFDSNKFSAWYEVDFETHSTEYEYTIDAVNGDILHAHNEPNT